MYNTVFVYLIIPSDTDPQLIDSDESYDDLYQRATEHAENNAKRYGRTRSSVRYRAVILSQGSFQPLHIGTWNDRGDVVEFQWRDEDDVITKLEV